MRNREQFTDLMLALKVSQRQLAAKAGVSQPYISLLIKGARGARPETAWRIASALGVLIEELFTREPAKSSLPAPASAPISPATLASRTELTLVPPAHNPTTALPRDTPPLPLPTQMRRAPRMRAQPRLTRRPLAHAA
ncbi:MULTISPECIES: helix-turn-helix domain-containing protein [unclassified Streptomyces]|uniref:helix-turn-helix domain-containing protein n=1 Tax=unclassified Streptomyces TaxID=2593676 RepID=UPI00227002F9|nr:MULTISPECIES: helix-turn-helix transcriptional regulator [unclassified Streptomyces]MCY0924321.1 helix-turn-helix transcriptional regulator [Streptomyces sp. H27-G5]MCY0963346.1 helix-turn-helix transcriptional regulator [Streptomyces sp. H27-H5]